MEVREAERGIEVRITENGKTELIIKRLERVRISKPEKWDVGNGEWYFWTWEELERARRDCFRRWLVRLGFEANAEKRVGIPVFFGEGDKVF